MTVHKRWQLQGTLKAHLESALESQGLLSDDAEPTRGDVLVYDDVIEQNDALFVRLDGFSFLQGTGGAGRVDTYPFVVHVFCRATPDDSDLIANEIEEVLRVQNLIINALDEFQPFDGAGGIEHRSSTDVPDENPDVHHGISRFKATIIGD